MEDDAYIRHCARCGGPPQIERWGIRVEVGGKETPEPFWFCRRCWYRDSIVGWIETIRDIWTDLRTASFDTGDRVMFTGYTEDVDPTFGPREDDLTPGDVLMILYADDQPPLPNIGRGYHAIRIRDHARVVVYPDEVVRERSIRRHRR